MERENNHNILKSPIVFVEPTNGCNLACEMCPTNREMERAKGMLDLDIFKKIIDDVSGESPFLNFWGWGEPLLHPEILEMTRYASDKGCKVRISSNIEPLVERKVDELLQSGLHMLLVPMDGFSQEAHGSYRVNGNVERVRNKVEKVCDRKKQLNLEKPYVSVLTLVTKQSSPEIPQIEKFCKDVGVDALILKLPNLWRSAKKKQDVVLLHEKFIVSDDAHASRYKVDEETGEIYSDPGGCPFLDKNGTVLWNGDVTTCCYDHEGRHTFGNVKSQGGYSGVLKSVDRKAAWKQMEEKQLDICNTCDASGPRRSVIIFNESLIQGDFAYL